MSAVASCLELGDINLIDSDVSLCSLLDILKTVSPLLCILRMYKLSVVWSSQCGYGGHENKAWQEVDCT